MELSSVRLIPFVFDKLLYHIAPPDATVCQNACQVFDLIAYRQLQYRLATPKKRMLLLAWPFCMHAGEHASNRYKQVEFYDLLRINVANRKTRESRAYLHHRDDFLNDQMCRFLTGFESFMLHCVLSNLDLYTDLNVLMLDFHAETLYKCDFYDGLQAGRSQWFLSASFAATKSAAARKNASKEPTLFMDPELWSKVINAVVAQCSSTLRHFVFCSSLWLPEQFYTSLKLDRILAQLHQLETLYMPSFEECEQAHTKSHVRGSCWQALIDLPPEKRLPSLRRVVAEHSLNSEDQLVFSDAGNNVGTRFVKLLSSTTLPQFHYLSPKLYIELVFCPSFDNSYDDIESKVRHALPNFACYARNADDLTLSQNTLNRQMRDNGCESRKTFREDIVEFANAVEISLLKVVQHSRPQMLSVINDVKADRSQKTTIPAYITVIADQIYTPTETVALALNTLSCRLSWPLTLTLVLDWECLLKHLSLFVVTPTPTANKQENDAAASHWTKCFPRGKLKLCVTVAEGLLYRLASHHPKTTFTPFLNFCAENRYKFPQPVTVKFYPTAMKMEYGENDTMPSIRKYYRKCMRKFVNDITGESSIFDNYTDRDILADIYAKSSNLRADLYASCQKLIIALSVQYVFSDDEESEEYGLRSENLRRVEQLLYDKRFEQELLRELHAKFSVQQENQQMFVLPNLKSISFVRDVFD